MPAPQPHVVIPIHAAAPAKPAWGEPCNGCGVCCLSEPCPVGMVLSRRRRGACVALSWDGGERRYRCGMVDAPERWLPLPWGWLRRALTRLGMRWIAAGKGCDCDIVLEDGEADQAG